MTDGHSPENVMRKLFFLPSSFAQSSIGIDRVAPEQGKSRVDPLISIFPFRRLREEPTSPKIVCMIPPVGKCQNEQK